MHVTAIIIADLNFACMRLGVTNYPLYIFYQLDIDANNLFRFFE